MARSTTSRYDRGKCFVFLNNRHYDPTTGVFISVDPLVTMTGQPYIYGAANPVRFSDPSGLEPRPIHCRRGCGDPRKPKSDPHARSSDGYGDGKGVVLNPIELTVNQPDPCNGGDSVDCMFQKLDGAPLPIAIWSSLIGPGSLGSFGFNPRIRGVPLSKLPAVRASGSRMAGAIGLWDDFIALHPRYGKIGKPGRVASAWSVRAGGYEDSFITASGQRAVDGAIDPGSLGPRRFTTKTSKNGNPRTFDAEVIGAEYLSGVIETNGLSSGTVDVFLNAAPCESCVGVLNQFAQQNPGWTVNVNYVHSVNIIVGGGGMV